MNSKLILGSLLLLAAMAGRVTAQIANDKPALPKDDPLAVKLTQNLSETDTC